MNSHVFEVEAGALHAAALVVIIPIYQVSIWGRRMHLSPLLNMVSTTTGRDPGARKLKLEIRESQRSLSFLIPYRVILLPTCSNIRDRLHLSRREITALASTSRFFHPTVPSLVLARKGAGMRHTRSTSRWS